MKKTLPLAFAAMATVAFAALATMNVTTSVSPKGLTVNVTETVPPNGAKPALVVTGTATATYGCVNRGGNRPKAANKSQVRTERFSVDARASGSANGTFTATIRVPTPDAGSFSCPSGQEMMLMRSSFSNVRVADTANNIVRTVSTVAKSF